MGLHKMSSDSKEMREKAFRLCKDYLRGVWREIGQNELVLKRISGGLSNWLYLCSLPASRATKCGEPSQVLLRLYGQIHGEKALEGLITESVIFTLLSERRLGPRLHGVFPGGRLEEYIPARPLKTRELSDPKLSVMVADKMARVHSMNVPISKEPRWLWDTMSRWMQGVQDEVSDEQNTAPHSAELVEKILSYNLPAELKWLKKQLMKVNSPVVFCHNDLQEGNILLRDSPANPNEQLVLIDFEYCSYNYRAFDIANHFCEWVYDYTIQQTPNFSETKTSYPTREQQANFVRSYLSTLANEKGYTLTESTLREEEANILREVNYFTLASHFFWGLWSLVNSKISQIPFGYLEYASCRFDAYFQHKSQLVIGGTCRELEHKVSQVPGQSVPGSIPGTAEVLPPSKRKAEEMLE